MRRLVFLLMALMALNCARPAERATRVPRDVEFVPSSHPVVLGILELARVTAEDVVYDLGSGDGRIGIGAARRGARSVGIEIDPKLVELSRENARAAGFSHLCEFRTGDLFQADLRPATVVTLYLLPELNLRLRPKLLKELRPGTRVVSNDSDMGDWKPDRQIEVDTSTLYLWTIR